jgi:hypothetical protein
MNGRGSSPGRSKRVLYSIETRSAVGPTERSFPWCISWGTSRTSQLHQAPKPRLKSYLQTCIIKHRKNFTFFVGIIQWWILLKSLGQRFSCRQDYLLRNVMLCYLVGPFQCFKWIVCSIYHTNVVSKFFWSVGNYLSDYTALSFIPEDYKC